MAKNRRTRLVNYDELYSRCKSPSFLNDVILENPDKNGLDLLFQMSEGSLDFSPSCECEAYRGKIYEGHVCPFCSSVIKSDFTSGYNPKNWIRIPEELPPLLHPRLYILLQELGGRIRISNKGGKDAGRRQKVPIIDFILDPTETLPDDLAEGIHGQGFTYFAQHIDEIIYFLCMIHPKLSKLPAATAIWKVYSHEKEANNVLTRKLPLLHPVFHPLHIRGKSRTLDKTADIIIPAVVDTITTIFANKNLVVPKKYADKELWKIFTKYVKYIREIMEHKIGDKQALIRRHNVASRMHFTGRAVISPITERHEGDEIHIPWSIGMMVMQLEIINFLVNREKTEPKEAIKYFYLHINKPTDLLRKCFRDLIRECPTKGIPCFLNRNPTLIRESIRMNYITRVKDNPHDKTINLPPLICPGFNADNDGDEMNMFLVKEQGIYKFGDRMHPREGILSETSLAISGWVEPPKEVYIHANQFLHYGRENTEPCMLTIPSDLNAA